MTEAIIRTPAVHPESESIMDQDLTTAQPLPTTIKQNDILEIPPSPVSLQNPPPPYSQLDALGIEQLLLKSQEVLIGHSEYLANGGANKDGEMLDKMTQLESLVASLQSILNDQTFAMHDLRSQLSDIQVVLKKMQDKQETMTSEEVMKQVLTMKALTENIIASSEANRQLGANVAAAVAVTTVEATYDEGEDVLDSRPSYEGIILPSITPSLSAILTAPPAAIQSLTISPQNSRATSRAPSRTPSRAPSRPPSCPSSRSVSRTVSPNRAPIPLSRSSSKLKIDLPSTPESPPLRPFKVHGDIPTIDENCEDEESVEGDTSLDRMNILLSSLINQATEAVERQPPRDKKDRTVSNSSQTSGHDITDILNTLDALEEEDDDDELFDDSSSGASDINIDTEPRGRGIDSRKSHKRQKSRNQEKFEYRLSELDKSMADFTTFVDEITTDENKPINNDYGLQYVDPISTLLQNPSENLADLDDFAQQCRLLTRALILPFLHATHSFMSESLRTTDNIHASRGLGSTTRTFMNLMYWTFLFTLGSLVLDAWLCEVAGRQVIRMVDMLKPGHPFGIIANGYGQVNGNQQDGGFAALDDCKKKKNVKFRTALKLRTVTWKGIEAGSVGGGKKWLRDGVMNLGKKGGRWGGSIFSRTTVGRFDEEFSEDSDEWEIVDFDSSDGEDIGSEDEIEEDPALILRRKITNELNRHAVHANDHDTEKEEYRNNVSSTITTDQGCDIKHKMIPIMGNSNDPIKITEEPGEYCMDEDYESDDEVDFNIPGSFPAAFKWTPPSLMVDVTEVAESVKRVQSVVLRRPKRNGPFGGSGLFCVMKTRRVRIRNTRKDVASAVLKSSSSKSSPISKKKSSKLAPIPKRVWVRRNSI